MAARADQAGETMADDAFVWSEHPASVTPFPPHKVTTGFRAYCTALKVKCRLHDLRHFAATQMLANGIDVRTAAGRLGHANAATTLKVYSHFVPSADVAAAKMLDELVNPSG
jgi:integrase